MRVGDVYTDPEAQVQVVFELVGTDCRTLPVSEKELLQWVETPEEEREDWTVALERHAQVSVAEWKGASSAVRRWAIGFAFSDPHVCVMPVEP